MAGDRASRWSASPERSMPRSLWLEQAALETCWSNMLAPGSPAHARTFAGDGRARRDDVQAALDAHVAALGPPHTLVLTGAEGSGKTTELAALVSRLRSASDAATSETSSDDGARDTSAASRRRRRLAALADSLARRPSVRPRALLRGPELLPGRRPLPGEVLPRAQAHVPHPRARALGPREPSANLRRVPRARRHVPPRPRRRRRRGERARRALRLLRRRRRRRRRSARTRETRAWRIPRGPSRARRVAAPIPSARRSVHPRRARRCRVRGRRPMPRCFENRRRRGGVARARVDDGIRDAPP